MNEIVRFTREVLSTFNPAVWSDGTVDGCALALDSPPELLRQVLDEARWLRVCSRCGVDVVAIRIPQKRKLYCPPCRKAAQSESSRASVLRQRSACVSCGKKCAGSMCMPCHSSRLAAARICRCGNRKAPEACECRRCCNERRVPSTPKTELTRARRRRASKLRYARGARSNEIKRWLRIAERDGWTCGICGRAIDRRLSPPHRMAASVDHVVPVSKGGSDEDHNLRAAHFSCNSRRGPGRLP